MAHPDESEWEEEARLETFLDDYVSSLSREPVFRYLATYGDAVQDRVDLCSSEAERLLGEGHFGPALVRAVTGIELTVKFFIVHPLIHGAFLSDAWTDIVTKRILSKRASDERDMLREVLDAWRIDLNKIEVGEGGERWESAMAPIWKKRNSYVHAGESGDETSARRAIECLRILHEMVVDPIADSLGFTRTATRRWSKVLASGGATVNAPREFERQS